MNLPLILLLLCLSSSFCINLERTDEPKYNIVIATSRDKVVGDLTGQEVPMTLQGVEYRCFLPQEEAEEETPLLDLDATPSPREFLEPLASQCLYRSTGWWTYELCHGKHIRQFHQERDLPIRPQDDFVLGKQVADDKQQYVITKLTSEDMKAPGKDYYAELYNFGTPCDLTTLQRQAEVRWFCTPDKTTTSIFDIREPASCTYVISVSTPHICKHPAFAVKREKTLSVTCIPLNEDSVLPKLKEPKIVKKEEKPQEQKQQQQQQPLQQQGQEQQEMVFYVTVDELINQLSGDNTELQEHILQQVTEQLQFIQQDEKQEELSEEDDTSRNKKRDVN